MTCAGWQSVIGCRGAGGQRAQSNKRFNAADDVIDARQLVPDVPQSSNLTIPPGRWGAGCLKWREGQNYSNADVFDSAV